VADPPLSARELLLAAEKIAAHRERLACAALVCELCAEGDPALFDPKKARERGLAATRKAIASAFAMEALEAGERMLVGDPDGAIRADANKSAHRKRCLLCRAASEELCRGLGAAGAVDAFLDHRRTCRDRCRTKKGSPPGLCATGRRLSDGMRSAACLGARDRREREELAAAEAAGGYPDEFFHVLGDGGAERCPATSILLRGPRPKTPSSTKEEERLATAIEEGR
jgi:hypothetical protein